MSAEVDLLREAAAQMREHAEGANTDDARRPYGDRNAAPVPVSEWGALVHNYLGGEIGDHCASWTPAAAASVASLLERAANQYETKWDTPDCPACADECLPTHERAEYHVVCEDWVSNCQCLAPFVVAAREFLRREAVGTDV